MKTNLIKWFCSACLLWNFAQSVAHAGNTNRWADIWESFRIAVADYAKTNYPQFFREVPITKRTQFNLFSVEQEIDWGKQEWAQIATNTIPEDLIRAQERLTNVAYRLVAAANSLSNIPPCAFEFRMLANSNFNAFCIAGGRIAVYSGVLSVIRDDDEFSFVIAHEIGHALARHAGETITREYLRRRGLAAAAFIADWAERQKHIQKETTTNILAVLDIVSALTVKLPHKREQEEEADRIGLFLMSKAGYRSQAAIDLWERMAKSQADTSSSLAKVMAEYCSDHPPDARRLANLKSWLPEVINH